MSYTLFDLLSPDFAELPDSPLLTLPVTHLTHDSRQIQSGSIFLAIPGQTRHALDYLDAAQYQAASAILFSATDANAAAKHLLQIKQRFGDHDKCLYLPALAQKLNAIAMRYLDVHFKKPLIGVTGTNGKTSITQFIAQLMPDYAVMGTMGYGKLNQLTPLRHTTPDAFESAQVLQTLSQTFAGVALEVSSHALAQHRIDALPIACAVFTNLTQDHLDFHGSLDQYFLEKSRLFHFDSVKTAIVNFDDAYGKQLIKEIAADKTIISIGFEQAVLQQPYFVHITPNQQVKGSAWLDYQLPNGTNGKILCQSQLAGRFNLFNLVAAITACYSTSGEDFITLIKRASHVVGIAGRMQKVTLANQAEVIIDYAHTPDALENALNALIAFQNPRGKCVVIFGCGGNRDPKKRPQMGKIAAQLADKVIITSDNPRDEHPQSIIDMIIAGIATADRHKVTVIVNRHEAIAHALAELEASDTLLIAGKGHETYQEINGKRHFFSDLVEVEKYNDQTQGICLNHDEIRHALADLLVNEMPSHICIKRINTDSRKIQAGDTFVALSGEQFDGHTFLAAAKAQGATCFISEKPFDAQTIQVKNTRLALAQLAHTLYQKFKRQQGKVVALTGSAGKTTHKNLLKAVVLQQQTALVTAGNLNNDLGVPLTWLSLLGQQQMPTLAIIEMGANHPHEIAYLASICPPDIALITNAADAHLAGFGDIAGVARAKGELFEALRASGIAIINRDDTFADYWQSLLAEQVTHMGFALDETACKGKDSRYIFATDIAAFAQTGARFTLCYHDSAQSDLQQIAITLPMQGLHQVRNALGVAAAALALGFDLPTIAAGFAKFVGEKGRLQSIIRDGIHWIDDSYNANLASMRASAQVLAAQNGFKIMVLGDMGELGEASQALHFQLGQDLENMADQFFCLGENMREFAKANHKATWFADAEALTAALKVCLSTSLNTQDEPLPVVLIKGSRSMQMEHILTLFYSHS